MSAGFALEIVVGGSFNLWTQSGVEEIDAIIAGITEAMGMMVEETGYVVTSRRDGDIDWWRRCAHRLRRRRLVHRPWIVTTASLPFGPLRLPLSVTPCFLGQMSSFLPSTKP
jgi:hypothetical protein